MYCINWIMHHMVLLQFTSLDTHGRIAILLGRDESSSSVWMSLTICNSQNLNFCDMLT